MNELSRLDRRMTVVGEGYGSRVIADIARYLKGKGSYRRGRRARRESLGITPGLNELSALEC
jgi:hypothetical protein